VASDVTPVLRAALAADPTLLTGGAQGAARRALLATQLDDARSWVAPNGYRLSDRVWLAGRLTRQRIDEELRRGVANGESPVVVARRLERYLDPAYAPSRAASGRLIRNQPAVRRVIRGGSIETAVVVTRTPLSAGAGSYAARRLARTEITRSHGQATVQAAIANPFVKGLRWRLSARHPKIDICDDLATADGYDLGPGVYPPGQEPGYPPHPQCFPAGTLVTLRDEVRPIEQVAIGDMVLTHEGRYRRVTAVHRRKYEGPMVLVSWEQGELLVSQEHPILTKRGWVEAAVLQPGDNLCRAAAGVRHDAFVSEVHNLPARLTEFRVAYGVGSIGMPLHAVALDDQSSGGNDEIGETASDSVPVLCDDSRIPQGVLHDPLDSGSTVRPGHPDVDVLQFAGGDAALHGLGHLGPDFGSLGGVIGALGRTDLGPSLGTLGRVCVAGYVAAGVDADDVFGDLPPTIVATNPAICGSLRTAAHLDAKPATEIPEHPEGDTQLKTNSRSAQALLEIEPPEKDLGRLAELGLDAGDMAELSLFILVSHVSILPNWTGELWNLEVEDDHTYAVQDVLVHNCLCVLVPETVDNATAEALIRQRNELQPPAETGEGGGRGIGVLAVLELALRVLTG
jgi:hypothetical protein